MSALGTFTSTNRAIEAAPQISSFIKAALNTGKIRALKDQCFWSGALLGQNSTMAFMTLPQGAVPILTIIEPINSSGVPTVTGNAITGTIGFLAGTSEDADLDALGTFTTLATVTSQKLTPTPDGTVYDGVTPLNEERQVSVLLSGAIEGVAGEGINLTVLYTISD